jgi:hypothetical protein
LGTTEMTTERQIASNQSNARQSTGPRTPEGKARSRANALKHGLAAETLVIDGLEADFAERKAEWEQDIQPTTPESRFALEAVVACTFRIEECRRNINARLDRDMTRACLVWDLDREADVALVASKLAKQPELVSHQLKSSKHGVELILRQWDRLGESLDTKKGAWSDAEISTAFDLLGVPSQLRDGRAPFDPRGQGEDVYQYRRSFIFAEGDRLRAQKSELSGLDRKERGHAETGASLLGTKPVALLLRYENRAWRRYDTMLQAARASAPQVVAIPEAIPEQDFAESDAAFEAEANALIASQTPAENAAMLAEMEAELVRRGYQAPNEPSSQPVASRPLNRHQRRKQASQARKG